MDEMTLGIIYALKNTEDHYAAVAKFMEDYTGHTNYTRRELYDILQQAFCNCLNYIDNPAETVKRYFSLRSDPSFYSPFDSMAIALQMLQVRRWNPKTQTFYYVNGFRPFNNKEIDTNKYPYSYKLI